MADAFLHPLRIIFGLASAAIFLLLIFPVPASAFVKLDTTAPIVGIVEPSIAPGAPVTTSGLTDVDIQAEYSDYESGVDVTSVRLTLDGVELTNNSAYSCEVFVNAVRCHVPAVTPGAHLIGGSVADKAGNIAPINGSFTAVAPGTPASVDILQPSITNTSGGTDFGEPVEIIGNVLDASPSSGIDYSSGKMSLNGGPATSCAITPNGVYLPNISCVLPASMPPGHYPYTIWVRDMAGNIGTDSGWFDIGVTVHLRDDATGGDCPLIGDWDGGTHSCKLGADFSTVRVTIDSDGITFDGNHHMLNAGCDKAVSISGRTGVTVKNLFAVGWDVGVSLTNGSAGNFIQDNRFYGGGAGMKADHSPDNTISDNQTSFSGTGYLDIGSSGSSYQDNSDSYSQTGLELDGSSAIAVKGNSFLNEIDGVLLSSSNANTLTGNYISHATDGAAFLSSSNNAFSGSTLDACAGHGLLIDQSRNLSTSSDGNSFYQNNFLNNNIQAVVKSGTGNQFSLPAPIGGNYWSDWTGPDNNGDGFVDVPYIFSGGQDELPWASARSSIARPALGLAVKRAYWQNFSSYTAGQLSIDFSITASGTAVSDVDIVGAINTNGVLLQLNSPVALGNIPSSGSANFTLQYQVSPGITTFQSTVYATAIAGGSLFAYPSAYPGS